MDAYRMQLWGRMAREVGKRQAQQQSQQQQNLPLQMPSPSMGHLTNALRPAFFVAPKDLPAKPTHTNSSNTPSSGLAALLSGKPLSSLASSSSSLPTPPSSPSSSHSSLPSSSATPTHAQALVAGLATQTLLSKLGGAFWDAFSRPSPLIPTSSSSQQQQWDHDKVRRVLEGKAVVKIVDVDPTSELEGKMRGLAISSEDKAIEKAADKEHCGWRKCAATVTAGRKHI